MTIKLQTAKAVIGGMIHFLDKYGGITDEHKEALGYLIEMAEKGEKAWVEEANAKAVAEN